MTIKMRIAIPQMRSTTEIHVGLLFSIDETKKDAWLQAWRLRKKEIWQYVSWVCQTGAKGVPFVCVTEENLLHHVDELVKWTQEKIQDAQKDDGANKYEPEPKC